MAMIAYEPSSETRHLGTQQKPWEKLYVKEIVGADGKPLDLSGAQIGDIKWSSVDLTQVGWLVATGAEVGRGTYPDLNKYYAERGYPWGAGDGSTTFNLPNLIGKFPEGANQAGGYKEAGLPNITGKFYNANDNAENYYSGAFYIENKTLAGISYNSTTKYGLAFDASKSNPIYGNSDTVQPPSALLIPYVKAFKGASANSTDLEISKVANDVARLSAQKLGKGLVGAYVTETKVNEDDSWYRQYSDGWIEQGGIANDGETVNFLKPFADVNYYIGGTTTNGAGYASCSNRTNTTIRITSTSGATVSWSACGMGVNV